MRNLIYFLLVFSLKLHSSEVGQSSSRAVLEKCSQSEFGQSAVLDCVLNEAKQSTIVLGATKLNAVNTLANWDEDKKYIQAAKKALQISHRDFELYRKSFCDFRSSLAGGGAGNSHAIATAACIADLNISQVEKLGAYMKNLSLKK